MANKKILSLFIGGLLSFGAVQTASAQVQQDWPVHDSTLNSQFIALNKQIEMLGHVSKTGSQVQQNNILAANYNANKLSIMEDQKRVVLEAAPTLDKCIATTRAMGLGRANAVVNHNQRIIRQNVTRASNAYGSTNLNAVTNSSTSLGTCKVEDIRDGINGCKGQEVGKYAGLDESITSINTNVLGQNRSVTYEQARVADRFIKNMVYGLAPERAPRDRANSSIYEAQRKIWNARMSTVSAAMADQLGWYTEIPMVEGSSLHLMWNSAEMNSVYGQTSDGSSTKPVNPSLAELVQAFVNKDFMYGGAVAVEQSNSQVDLLRRMNQKQALANFMQYRELQMLEHMSNQLGTIATTLNSPLRNMNQNMQSGN